MRFVQREIAVAVALLQGRVRVGDLLRLAVGQLLANVVAELGLTLLATELCRVPNLRG